MRTLQQITGAIAALLFLTVNTAQAEPTETMQKRSPTVIDEINPF
ncbi:hypothetical protein [Bdellovibrio bacteriovorus]